MCVCYPFKRSKPNYCLLPKCQRTSEDIAYIATNVCGLFWQAGQPAQPAKAKPETFPNCQGQSSPKLKQSPLFKVQGPETSCCCCCCCRCWSFQLTACGESSLASKSSILKGGCRPPRFKL